MRNNKILIIATFLLLGIPCRAQAQNEIILTYLDADQNGLYDDKERKAMLDVLQQQCPELAGTFDANGDGMVSVEEQTAGRHPLTLLIPKNFLANEKKIPWSINIFSEWISSAYLQEDVGTGSVSEHKTRGTITANATQTTAEKQPGKSTNRGGVEFAANSGQYLTMPGHRDARWSYRWCLFTFRIDANTGTDKQTVLLDLNKGEGSNNSSPKIWYDKETGLNVQYQGRNKDGLDRRIMKSKGVVADGTTWNVVVCGIRYGQLYVSLNGIPLSTETKQPDRFSGQYPSQMSSYIGDQSLGNMAWAYDALVFGLTEPSEAMVRKMTGWAAHRLGFEDNLPEGHPYRTKLPVVDAEDFPYRYLHDDEKWTQWGESLKQKEITRQNAGGPRMEPRGFERVFYDDFRSYRATPGTSGESGLWHGYGFNPAVGVDAPLIEPGQDPDTYPYDKADQKQILSLVQKDGKWRGSALYSVNDLGHGYTWTGPKIFRVRCMFPESSQNDLAGGLFPAFWSYDPDFLFWRTANRIEVDWFEFDGQNGWWYNGMSSHLHYSHLRNNIFAKNSERYKSYKAYSGEFKEEKSNIPGGLFFWDGVYHTWEFVVEEDMTYVNVTVQDSNGQDKWVEVMRCATAPTYLERLDLQLDYALRANYGVPGNGERQDFVVDWIEVLQKSTALEVVPEPFSARPKLSGTNTQGSTVSCEANVKGVTDIRYYWYADDYPVTWGTSNTLPITAAEAGKSIRCMVKAVGALNMPEAWSNTIGTPTSIDQESKLNTGFELFPNPANSFTYLKMLQEVQNTTVDILNMQGKTMKSFCLSNGQNRLDLSLFPSGIYLARMRSEENYIVKKLIKQ